jgi:hypothetical protein
MGASERRKGVAFEQRCARWLRRLLPYTDFQRVLDETQQGNRGDVRDAKKKFADLVGQCKWMKKPSPLRALDQAREAAETTSRYPELGVAFVHEINGTDAVLMDPKLFGVLLVLVDDLGQEVGLATEDLIKHELDKEIDYGWTRD